MEGNGVVFLSWAIGVAFTLYRGGRKPAPAHLEPANVGIAAVEVIVGPR